MIKLTFVTSNEGKLQEARHVLASFDIELDSFSYDFVEPTSGKVHDVALAKLRQVLKQGYQNLFVEDSGLFFAAYDQFPGVLSKRIFERIGYRGFAKLLHNERKDAWFTGSIALGWQGKIQTFSSTTHGKIKIQKELLSSESGLPFDPIFIPVGEERVLRQLSFTDRLSYSYRRNALIDMANWLHSKT